MKDLFPGYYSLGEDEEREIWSSCLFVFDANVLLNLYCMKPEDRSRSLRLFAQLGDRLWIPHQVAAEYQRRRAKVIRDQIGSIQALSSRVKDAEKLIRTALPEQHPFTGADKDQEDACGACQKVRRSLDSKRGHYQRLLEDDTVRNELDAILRGRVGRPYEPVQLLKVLRRGEKRYSMRFPPGFADEHKGGVSAFGDWIIWNQILDKVKIEKRSVLFVTDDTKEDWWITDAAGNHWPRDELVDEMKRTAGTTLQLHTSRSFLEKGSCYLSARPANTAKKLSDRGAWDTYRAAMEGMLRMQKQAASQLPWLLPIVSRAMDQIQHTGTFRAVLEAQKAAEWVASSPFGRSAWEVQRLAERIGVSPLMRALAAYQARFDPLEDGSQNAGATREQP